jgi:tripartite-type tricarboxylate transporter receptor subunit TctC
MGVGTAAAEDFPAGALRLIVPFPAGGPTDAVARIFAEALKDVLARPVIVENKPGAAGTIGVRYALQAAANGTTWLIGNNQTHATAPFLIKDAGYDPRKDFASVASLVDMHHVLVARNDLGVTGLPGLIAMARATPGTLNFGSTGIGSGSHLSMEMLMAKANLRLQHVPFQGAGQMAGEISAGRLDLALAVLPTVSAAIAARQLRALGVAGRARAPQLPSVPTLAEQGVPETEAESWLALFAAARTPPALTEKMGQIVRHCLTRADVAARIEALGLSVRLRDGAALHAFQAAEITRWADVIKAAGLQPE